MNGRPVEIGDILLAALPEHIPSGHEQHGVRPAIVVGLPQRLGTPRFPMLIGAPLTTQIEDWATDNPELYPLLPTGTGGLHQSSIVLLDHLRAIDQNRIQGYIGTLNPSEYNPIQTQLLRMLKK